MKNEKEIVNLIIQNIGKNNYYNSVYNLLKLLPHKLQVQIAYNCTLDAQKYYDHKQYPKVKEANDDALNLLAKWLENPDSVTDQELRDAATTADNAATTADNAAHATRNAAKAAFYAARNAAANAAFYAAKAAYAAANAAAWQSDKNYDSIYKAKIKEYYHDLIHLVFQNIELTPELELLKMLYF